MSQSSETLQQTITLIYVLILVTSTYFWFCLGGEQRFGCALAEGREGREKEERRKREGREKEERRGEVLQMRCTNGPENAMILKKKELKQNC